MTYQEFKQAIETLEERAKSLGAARDTIHTALAERLGIPMRGPMGLTPDPIRTNPEYRAARMACDAMYTTIRSLNAKHAARFKKEIRADIEARRMARLAAACPQPIAS